ncbi:oligoendopeptidase [Pullulanibacillus camelliae]|uniref:Oligoendopeptidase n=1 Tax=Pullulanibacillus camelliae TaxID=1707096 RepID=A0A8J2YIF4_9BACL|nr:M3 family oligoendopeptidase [Pullulanibacillus camelliae]GGE45185.1 oligoendopeptidase [Pullulanibacillus camelliae]
MTHLNQTWNLDAIFPGGSASEAFSAFFETLENETQAFYDTLQSSTAPKSLDHADNWLENLYTYENLAQRLVEASAFTSCLRAQNMQDKHADILSNSVQSLFARFKSCETLLDTQIAAIPEATWEALLKTDTLKDIQFSLNEKRRKAQEQLPVEQEQLVNALSVDGYHAWGDLYDVIVGEMTIPFNHPEKGEQELSVGQLANALTSSDRSIRQQAFNVWENVWKDQAALASSALNHLAGFRLSVYKQRGWDDVLKEPLDYNRMTRKTLETMWQTIESYKPHVVKYLRRKAELLGLEKLDWHDVEAPIAKEEKAVAYEEAAEFIIKNFSQFNPAMGTFAKKALENRWVEAEDRSGKRPGGFCTSFPLTKESRIFMTYSGSPSNVSTLAHELGHAYHQHVMNDIPYLNQDYAMNVAETASTFAELIVSDAAIKSSENKEGQLSLLEDKLQRAVAFFMNIHARFLFETRFYEERKKGLVSVDRLNNLMLEAQKEAFCDELSSYHPAFWESKLHFYITDVPFYNFPYTFGYMFSTGIYARALEEGPAFAEKYDALLRDTGAMTVEELALKHLGSNLEQDTFWKDACEQIVQDIDLFLKLTEK